MAPIKRAEAFAEGCTCTSNSTVELSALGPLTIQHHGKLFPFLHWPWSRWASKMAGILLNNTDYSMAAVCWF